MRAHEPQVVRQPPARLTDVVDGDVLEKARHRIEPQAPVRVHVGQADAATRGVRAPARRKRDRRVKHNVASLLAAGHCDKPRESVC